MKKVIQVFLFFWVCVFPLPASAQVLIEQGKVELTAVPGQTLTGAINVHNTTDQPVSVRVYLADFLYLEPFNGKKDFLAAGSTEYSMAGWFSFLPRELTLQPFQKQEINYSIQVPADARGGYYNVLFVERDAGVVGEGAMAGVQIISRVGSLFFVETADSQPQGKVENIQFADGAFQLQLTNTGETIIIPESTYFIMDQEGRAIKRGEADLLYLPPGKTAQSLIPLDEGLNAGAFTLVLTIDLGEGQAVVREIEFQKLQSNDVEILEIRE